MLTVFNVKQGDSMLLAGASATTCCFDDEPLLVDCGLQKAAVYSKLGSKPKRIRVLITHADLDHIGGLHDVLANHHVSRLYVPRYLPEIRRIEDYLRKKDARKGYRLPSVGTGRRIEVAEGDQLCCHAKVMNPPKSAAVVLKTLGTEAFSNADVQEAVTALQARGLGLDLGEILDYTPEPITHVDRDAQSDLASVPKSRERVKFFRGFFVYLAEHLQKGSPSRDVDLPQRKNLSPTGVAAVDRAVSQALQLAANQVSVVFRYAGTSSFLFTGDADTSVFHRMRTKGHNLQSAYLKVPHHGSRHNLDAASLTAINPKFAIVSHGNRKFGRDPDTHPHNATMQLLSKRRVTVYYTNDVLKAGKVVARAQTGNTRCKRLQFR